MAIEIVSFCFFTAESDGRSAQDSRVSANPFDIRVERTGGNNTNNYNVSWTTAEIADVDATTSDDERNRLVKRRYVVKWYDAVDGKELGSTSTAANERYVGQLLYTYIVYF